MNRDGDNIYIEKVLSGDRNAYAVLVDRYKNMVFTLALRLVRNREEAEEIAQDSFVKAFKSLAGFRGKSKFSTWLYRIVYNTAISNMRKKESERIQAAGDNLPDTEPDESQSMYASLTGEERKKFIDKALEILSEEERFLVIMHYYEERDLDELAEITGLTKTNAKVRLHRSRRKMLTYLKTYLKEETYSLL